MLGGVHLNERQMFLQEREPILLALKAKLRAIGGDRVDARLLLSLIANTLS